MKVTGSSTPYPIRLALRAEGAWWIAYMAKAETMEGAERIGSILLGAVVNKPERKKAFMDLMTAVMGDAIEEVTGETPNWKVRAAETQQ